MAVALENARQEWEDGYRRFAAEARDPHRAAQLHAQLDVVTAELRRRIGQTFSLADLARVYYADADTWVREAVADRAAAPGWPRTVTLAADAAFHLYQRGAADYAP